MRTASAGAWTVRALEPRSLGEAQVKATQGQGEAAIEDCPDAISNFLPMARGDRVNNAHGHASEDWTSTGRG